MSDCKHDGEVALSEVWTGETCKSEVRCLQCCTVIQRTVFDDQDTSDG